MVQLSGHRIYDAGGRIYDAGGPYNARHHILYCTMLYDAVKLGKNPALPGPLKALIVN